MSKLNAKAEPKQASLPVPHIHHDAIVAFAQGYKIQRRKPSHPSPMFHEWKDCGDCPPKWNTEWEYRKKPDPVKDIVELRDIRCYVSESNTVILGHISATPNVLYTFDGETKKLKDVELLE